LHLIDSNYWEEWDSEQVRYRDEAEAGWLKYAHIANASHV